MIPSHTAGTVGLAVDWHQWVCQLSLEGPCWGKYSNCLHRHYSLAALKGCHWEQSSKRTTLENQTWLRRSWWSLVTISFWGNCCVHCVLQWFPRCLVFCADGRWCVVSQSLFVAASVIVSLHNQWVLLKDQHVQQRAYASQGLDREQRTFPQSSRFMCTIDDSFAQNQNGNTIAPALWRDNHNTHIYKE